MLGVGTESVTVRGNEICMVYEEIMLGVGTESVTVRGNGARCRD